MAGASDFMDDEAGREPENERNEGQPQVEEQEDDGLPSDEEEASEGSGGDDEEGGSGSDADSSDEGEDEDEFEEDGFIVNEAEDDDDKAPEAEGSDVEDAAEAKKRRKKKRRRELVLDEEDYELLEDNTGIRRQRPRQQHRRIKKARDAGAVAAADSQDAARALQEELFGLEDEQAGLEDDEDEAAPGRAAAAVPQQGGDARGRARDEGLDGGEDQFEDDEDDWLVHEDEEEEGAAAAGRQRRRRRRAAADALPGVDADALAEADDIFGNVDDLLAMYEDRRRQRQGEGEPLGEDLEEEEDDLEEGDDEAAAARREAKEERQRAAAARRLQQQLDPEAMARHFMLPRDEQIRTEDLPEREQLQRGPDPQPFDLAACAAWVWDHLVGGRRREGRALALLEEGVQEVQGPPPAWYGRSQWSARDLKGAQTSIGSHRGLYVGREGKDAYEEQRAWRHNEAAQGELREAIRKVLAHVYERHEEVPFVAQYRKEVCGELLVLSGRDEPRTFGGDKDRDRVDENNPAGKVKASGRKIRRYDVMYAVLALAQQWRAMQVRREARRAAFEKALGETMVEEERADLQACLAALDAADSVEELDDAEARFRLAQQRHAPDPASHAPDEPLSQLSLGATKRRPLKSSPYALCVRAGLGGWVAGLGLTAEQLAENVEAGLLKHTPTSLPVLPEEHAERFVAARGGFASAAAVMRGGVRMAAEELAAEPLLRQEVRKMYWDKACVWTVPTAAGEAALDPFHPLGAVKRLAAKPLHKFEASDQFLRLLQAEQDGLITVTIGFVDPASEKKREQARKSAQEEEDRAREHGGTPRRHEEVVLRPEERPGAAVVAGLEEYYLSGGLSDEAQAWDRVRLQVLEEAVRGHLWAALEREARSRLAAAARAAALDDAGDRLWAYASQAPLQLRLVEEEEVEAERRVMAVSYGPGSPATTFAMLDPGGNLVDYLHCPQFSGPIPRRKALPGLVYSMYDDPKKGQDAARIRKFIEEHKPHAIVVGASHPEARTLEQDLLAIKDSILLDNPRFVIGLGTGDLQIMMVDEAVPAAWENSVAAQEELGAATAPIVRRAVGLGRQLLDPLALLASLCGGGREVLALPLHPLQAQLPAEERLAMVERVMVSATSQVGLDLNAAAASTWLSAPLQFVPGLGPRKAAALLRAVARAGGFVESRQQVWRDLGVFGNRVFRNAAPYLRIRASVKGAANLELDPLDDTRIHPASYGWAVQMAQSAVADDDAADAAAAVENAFARPQEVESLDLVFYAEHLQQLEAQQQQGEEGEEGEAARGADHDGFGGALRLATLIDIQMEFAAPYGELRRELKPPEPQDLFYLCAGETKETLREGRRVEARVRNVGDREARCVLPDLNGIEAELDVDSISSRAAASEAAVSVRDFFQPNDTVTCRIIGVDAAAWLVRLASRSDVVADERRWEREHLARYDRYYVLPPEKDVKQLQREAAEAKKRQRDNKIVHRPIQHPLFRNVKMVDAAAELAAPGVEVGRAVLRPSFAGPRFLCLTMRTPDAVLHVTMEEMGKSATDLKLGKRLVVPAGFGLGEEAFEDLDELTARYVEPMASHMQALVAHRKWKGGSWEHVQEELRAEKLRLPDARMAVTCLGEDASRGAAAFYLGFVLRENPRREFFAVNPQGFYFRKTQFRSIDAMLAAFKKRPYYLVEKAAERQQQQQGVPPPPPTQQQQQQQVPPRGVPAGMMAGPGVLYQGMPQQPQPGLAYSYAQQAPPQQYGGGAYGGGGGYGGAPPDGPPRGWQQDPPPGGWPLQQQAPPYSQQGWGGGPY